MTHKTPPFHSFIEELQVIRCNVGSASPRDLMDRCERLIDGHADFSGVEHTLGFGFVVSTAQRICAAYAHQRLADGLPTTDFEDAHDIATRLRRAARSPWAQYAKGFSVSLHNRLTDRTLSAGHVASDLHITRFHLARLLAEATGHNFRWHVNSRRLAYAQRLLRHSNLALKEIAADVGFASASQLSNRFRDLFGVTPSTFRRLFRT